MREVSGWWKQPYWEMLLREAEHAGDGVQTLGRVFMMARLLSCKRRSVFCIPVVDGEGDKGQGAVTSGWASGGGGALALQTTEKE